MRMNRLIQPSMSPNIETLLQRSAEFELALHAEFPELELRLADSSPKLELVATAVIVSLEHGSVLRKAIEVGASNTGAALLRLQNEAVLKAAWLLFTATPPQVEKLAVPLESGAEQAAKGLPGYLDMLAAVQKSGPAGLTQPLMEFNQYSRHALNSFVHTGIHPLSRTKEGFPLPLAEKILKFANAHSHLAYRILAVLTGEQQRMNQVTKLYLAFADCLPMTTANETNPP